MQHYFHTNVVIIFIMTMFFEQKKLINEPLKVIFFG